jgi:hypothetical protein
MPSLWGPEMSDIYVIHENPDWLPPFAAAFEATGVPWREWLLTDGAIDLDSTPPDGVFYSRMSASSHMRGHTASKDYTRSVLSWLESHGRTVVNGRRVLELEMSKVDQHAALRAAEFDVPRTIAVVDRSRLLDSARQLPTPFITKHNQGGRGLGVRKFEDLDEFEAYVNGPEFDEPVDDITLLQEYVQPADDTITRVEIVGGQFLYAQRADTRMGFELCPADDCDIDGQPTTIAAADLFHWRAEFDHPIVDDYIDFCRQWEIGIAGIEFIESADGRMVTYDINTNTNYNTTVEAEAGRSGPAAVARYLASLRALPAPASLRSH